MATIAKDVTTSRRRPVSGASLRGGLDEGFNARRLRSNLLRSRPAMDALEELGLDRAVVERVGLGMKEVYVTASGLEVSGVMTYPLETDGARRRYGYVSVDRITVNPDHPIAWSPGAARAVVYGQKGVMLVLASPLALFQARSVIEQMGIGVAATASSQPDRVPAEWMKPAFWASWDRIILDEAVPPSLRSAVARAAMRPIEIATGLAIDDRSSGQKGVRLEEWVEGMLSEARPFVIDAPASSLLQSGPGDFAASTISLHGGVADGRMYYPFMIERRRSVGGGGLVCSYETIVLRSDGAVLEARTLPAPPGTPASQRVHCLTDGTRISSPPTPSTTATWSLASIQAFVASRGAGVDPAPRAPANIIEDVHDYLLSRVTLPEPEDLWVAASFVVLTHMFRVFPSIPLLLIEGPHGSGKSELAAAIAALGFNAVTMGQGSAASLVRLSQECGGLVVLDDVEALKAGGAGFGDLSQCLKVGYRASTARKPITLGSGRVETFDFFGPRVLTCTRGVEPILRSRCISIGTAVAAAVNDLTVMDADQLRDELHVLGMTCAGAVAEAFRRTAHNVMDRADEIWAPLLAIAEVMNSAEALRALDKAKERHAGSKGELPAAV